MSELTFHKCKLCKCIFYSSYKSIYCAKCVPKYEGGSVGRIKLCDLDSLTSKRAKERARWHARMANPAFRERERLRSLARARAEKKYAIKEVLHES